MQTITNNSTDTKINKMLKFNGSPTGLFWKGSPRMIAFDPAGIEEKINNLEAPIYVVRDFSGRVGLTNDGTVESSGPGLELLMLREPMQPEQLGDPTFRRDYSLRYA